jgi:hypothetical protein
MSSRPVARSDDGWLSADSFARLLVAYALALACVQGLTIGLSLAGTYIGQGLSVGVLALAAFVGAYAGSRWRGEASAPDACGDAPAGLAGRLAEVALATSLMAGYLILWWIAFWSVDLTCDGNAYHLPPISLWWRVGRVHWIDPRIQLEPLMNGYPKGVELVGYILSRALDTSAVANGLNLIYLPLGVLGLGYLTRRLGGARWAALLAGLLYLLLPVTIWQSPTAYLDSAYASAFIGLAAAMVMGERAWRREGAPVWRHALALGATAGLALGAKGSSGVTVAVAFVLLLVASIQNPCGAKDLRGRVFMRSLGVLAVAAAVALAIGGYWYVRNWVHTGTPLYPIGLSVGDRVIFPGASVADALWEEGNTPALYKPWPAWRRIGYAWLQGLEDWPRTVFAVDGRLGGLGYVWVLGGLPAALYVMADALLGKQAERRAWLFLVVLVVASFAVTPMRWWARYTLWLHALGLPALTVILSRLARARGAVRLAWAWGLAVLVMAGREGWLCGQAMTRSVYPNRWPPTVAQLARPASWWRPHIYLFPEAAGTVLSDILASDDPVAVGHMWGSSPSGRWKHNMLGALTQPLGHRDLMPLPEEVVPDDRVPLRDEMRARGIRYVILDDQEEVPVVLRYLAEDETVVPGFVVLMMPVE